MERMRGFHGSGGRLGMSAWISAGHVHPLHDSLQIMHDRVPTLQISFLRIIDLSHVYE